MNNTQNLFLQLFARGVQGDVTTPWPGVEEPDWVELANLAARHHVLPMIYHQINVSVPFQLPEQLHREWRCHTVGQVLEQERKSKAFLSLYQLLRQKNLTPVVVKGIVLRSLYPQPNHRPSSDEDLWVAEETLQRYEAVLSELGFEQVAGGDGNHRSYHHAASGLHLELHGQPFAQDGPCGTLNNAFRSIQTQWAQVNGVEICTLEPTQHFIYLVCHAYQHFISCGVGIRQLGDVAVFAQTQQMLINWSHVEWFMRQYRLQGFWQTVCRILHTQLHLLPERCIRFCKGDAPLEPLLEDILDGGVYGKSSLARTASSQWMSAAAQGQGEECRNLLEVLFPCLYQVQRRYTWLRHRPILLPLAWGWRWMGFIGRLVRHRENPMETWSIARERVKLARAYEMIE